MAVRLQQGVPIVDADWNELNDIVRHELYQVLAMAFRDGFAPGSPLEVFPGGPNDFSITFGTELILEGRPLRIQTDKVHYAAQCWPDPACAGQDTVEVTLPVPLTTHEADREDIIYLDVWEREVGRMEDPELINPAIEIETCVRLKRELAIRVAEGSATLPPAPEGHAHLPLALLRRPAGEDKITNDQAEDIRPVLQCLLPSVPTVHHNYISTWLVLGPIFDPAHQIGRHSDEREQDKHPWADEIIADIDNRGDQLNPLEMTASPDNTPSHGDTLVYGDHKGEVLKERTYRWRIKHFVGVDWANIHDIEDNIHKHLPGDYADDPFDPGNYLNFEGKHHALVFVLVYIKALEARRTKLCVRSDDAVRVWLDGEEIEALKYAGNRNSARIEDDRGLRYTTDNPNKIHQGIPKHGSRYESISIPGRGNGWNPADPTRTLEHEGNGIWKGRVKMVRESYKFAANGSWETNWGVNGKRDGDNYSPVRTGRYEIVFNENDPGNPELTLIEPVSE